MPERRTCVCGHPFRAHLARLEGWPCGWSTAPPDGDFVDCPCTEYREAPADG